MSLLPAVEALLEKDEKTLFVDLGRSIAPVRLGADEPDDESFEQSGRAWFSQRKAEITKMICLNKRIRQLTGDPQLSNRTQIITTVVDVFSSLHNSYPIVTLTALIIKEGLVSFCKNCNEHPNI